MQHDGHGILLALNNLRGKSRDISPERALEILKEVTGEDFGYDADAWENWWKDFQRRQKEAREAGINSITVLIRNLRGQSNPADPYHHSSERALEILKEVTGEDFGYDADAWENWHKERILIISKRHSGSSSKQDKE